MFFGPSFWLPSNPPTTATFAQRTTRSSTTWTTTRTTPRAALRTSPVKTEEYNNKYKHQGGNELATFLCNTLEKHGEQPGKVLRLVGLASAEWNEPASVTALIMTAQKHFPGSVPSDTDDDDDTDYDAAAAHESDD
jgi:hypothetical protein